VTLATELPDEGDQVFATNSKLRGSNLFLVFLKSAVISAINYFSNFAFVNVLSSQKKSQSGIPFL